MEKRARKVAFWERERRQLLVRVDVDVRGMKGAGAKWTRGRSRRIADSIDDNDDDNDDGSRNGRKREREHTRASDGPCSPKP